MTTLQEQARALGEPTRHGIFRYVVDAAKPVDVAELTAHFGLNHNAIRQHLAKLVAAGLVQEGRAPAGGRGRPRLLYSVDPATDGRWGVTGPYERLSLWLSEMVRTGDSPAEVGRRAGRRQRLGRARSDDPVRDMLQEMERLGFEPAAERTGRSVEVTLGRCPFASTAVADPDTVCGLHLGMARGLAEVIGGIEVDELVPRDPRQAQCRLRCRLAEGAGRTGVPPAEQSSAID